MNDASEEVTEETPGETSAATQTDWHRLLALVQELALVPLLIEVLTELLADLKPIKIDLVLLRRKSARWTAEQVTRLPDGIRQSVANHILCEFKYTQSVNQAALVQALIYDFLYRSSRKLARQKVATFVISARTPRQEVLQEFGYVATDLPGVYRSTQTLLAPITLLVLNQLTREPHNALFKIFAGQRKERAASFALLEQIGAKRWSPELGEVLTGLQTLLQQQEGDKMKEIVIDPEYVKRLGREMEKTVLANLTTEKLLAALSQRLEGLEPEVVLSHYAPEQRLAGLEPEQRLAGLEPEQRLAGLEPEQRLEGLDLDVIEAYLRQHKQIAESSTTHKKPADRHKSKPKNDPQR